MLPTLQETNSIEIYQLRIRLLMISPMISRRIWVRSDSSIAELHETIQCVMGWRYEHLHRFVIRGVNYDGANYLFGLSFINDGRKVRLRDFNFRERERFLYEYDLFDSWRHEVRFEKRLPHSNCQDCGRPHRRNGRHHITYRTLFGKMRLQSPRFYTCACRPREQKSFSPVVHLLPERSAPELCYLQTKWASLMSYGLTVDLLGEVLPLKTNFTSVYKHTHQTAKRIESELGEEQLMFAHGNEYDRHALPHPDEPLTVGVDGGFVHGRDGDNRKAGWFEVIVGKSIQDNHDPKRFGFVTGHDEKPKRRLYETLYAQGLQMNQAITFLSDGGDTVRNLQYYMSPVAEHILDWFHVTMRLTVMGNLTKGLPKDEELAHVPTELERIKWFLWHGNTYKALEALRFLEMDLEMFENEDEVTAKLHKHVQEFAIYIHNNRSYIPNYGDRYRYGEMISTAFVESTVNELISKRMVKKQQMRWTKEGAHLLLQTRVKTLDGDLSDKFVEWYPDMEKTVAATLFPAGASSSLSC